MNKISKILILTTLIFFNFQALSQDLTEFSWRILEATGNVTARHESAFVEFEGKFYLIGGRGVNPVNVFNPKNNQWSALSPTPFEVHHFQPVVYNDAIYIVGGMTGGYPRETPLENIWIFYPNEDKWVKSTEIPEDRRRGGAGVVVYDDKFYMVCGIDFGHTSGTSNLFDSFDPATGKWTILTKAPTIRDHFSAVVVNDKLFCIGGRNSSYHEPDNFAAFFGATNPYVDVYDFKTRQWITLAERFPVPAAAPGIVSIGDHILCFGGESNQSKAHNETHLLNTQTGEWTQLSPMVTGRHGSGAIYFDSAVFIAAGSPNRGGGNLSSIEKFSLK